MLIIAPKKVAEATWQNEVKKWEHLKLLRISTVLGTEKQRVRALNSPADVYIINRENVVWLVDYYRNAWPFDMLVLDESSSFKNHQAKRFKALKLIVSRTKRIVELTGTPAPKGLIDLWAQIFLLDGGERLGKTIGGYRERYFNPDQRNATTIFSYAPKNDAEAAIHRQLADIAVSMKAEDWLELPEIIYDTVPVVLDAKAEKAYTKLEREMLLEIPEGEITAQGAGVLTGKLLQLCNGAVYDADSVAAEIHNCKLEAFAELIEALQGQAALVFYNFQHDRDRILSALKKSGLRVKIYKSPADEEDWNNGKIDILLAHPASCAYGLNLQRGGRHIIWFGLQWSLELYQQANKRLHRQGQNDTVKEGSEILYGYAYCQLGDIQMPPGASQNRTHQLVFDTKLSNATGVTITYDGSAVYMSHDEFTQAMATHNTDPNAHPDLRDAANIKQKAIAGENGEALSVEEALRSQKEKMTILGNSVTLTVNIVDLQNTINNLPKFLNYDVTINVNPGTYNGQIKIERFFGPGGITLTGASANASTHNIGNLLIERCNCNYITIRGFNATATSVLTMQEL